jgi:hypothetical protein
VRGNTGEDDEKTEEMKKTEIARKETLRNKQAKQTVDKQLTDAK